MKRVKSATPTGGASVQKSENRVVLGICVLLALAVFAVFGQTIRYEFVNFDDDLYVYENPVVLKGLTLAGVSHVFTHQMCDFYHPLTMLSLMLDHQVYGLNAGGYHLTNVLLHAATAVLLFLVLRRMMGVRVEKIGGAAATPMDVVWPSAFVAALFAVHPLRVESVAWVTERKDVLSGLFFVLTLWAYVRYTRTPFSLPRYLTVIFLFALGLLSKPSLVTLPFLLLLLDFWPLGRMQPSSPRPFFKILHPLIIEKIPLFVLSALLCVATLHSQENYMTTAGELPFMSRLSFAAVSYVAYLGQMFYPAGLIVLYPFPQNGPSLPEVVLALALLTGISAGAVALRRRWPYLLVGWLWYLGMLVPMIGLIHTGTVARADRFTYLAQIGVYIILTWAVKDWAIYWRYDRRVLGAGALSAIVVLMACAWKQTTHWRNNESLWTHTLAFASDNPLAENNFGYALLDRGEVNQAITHLQKALQINPNYAEARNNLGNALLRKGEADEAIVQLQQALQIMPRFVMAQCNVGDALLQKGQVDEAIVHFQQALEIDPGLADAHNSLGNALLQKGDGDGAIAQFQTALQTDPGLADAHNNLGNALLLRGDVDGAIAQFQTALQQKPNYAEAHYNLGNALFNSGRVDEAIVQFQQALQIYPGYAKAHNNLGSLLLRLGRDDEAIAHFQQALQLKPDFAEAQINLAWLLATSPQASLRNGSKAVELAQRAHQLAGNENPAVLCTLAAAYAEAGRFSEAVESAQRALQLALAQSNTTLADAIQSQLKLYQAGIAFHSH